MEYLLIGIVSAFNLLVIKFKIEKKRYADGILDLILMVILAYLFGGSYGGMVVAMVASLVISVCLFISPPAFTGTWFAGVKKAFDETQKINPIIPPKPKGKP